MVVQHDLLPAQAWRAVDGPPDGQGSTWRRRRHARTTSSRADWWRVRMTTPESSHVMPCARLSAPPARRAACARRLRFPACTGLVRPAHGRALRRAVRGCRWLWCCWRRCACSETVSRCPRASPPPPASARADSMFAVPQVTSWSGLGEQAGSGGRCGGAAAWGRRWRCIRRWRREQAATTRQRRRLQSGGGCNGGGCSGGSDGSDVRVVG